jgi:uridylate kinase
MKRVLLKLSGEALANGSGEIYDVGVTDNEVNNVIIIDERGKDVTANYKIETVLGELRVTR